jgi:hypothetical protein
MSEASFQLKINGQEFTATRKNATVFTFLGDLACYDHIFLNLTDEIDDANIGYIWCSSPNYEKLANFMDENKFPMHLNMPEVHEMDVRHFETEHYGDIRSSDFVPEWF